MKTALKISLILNLALLAGLILVFGRASRLWEPTTAAPMTVGPNTAAPAPVITAAKPLDLKPAEPSPFHWNQLDANDYHVYVKNLRATGCPEPTVRAIVTADVDSVYQIFANQLEQKLSAAENGSWSNQLSASSSEPALKDALQRIPEEESAKTADLLGLKPAPMPAETANPPPLAVPLVMQNIDLAALNLTADQQRVIAGLRQDFLKQVGGTNQDPNDLAYQARWQQAQPYADNMLEALLGNDVYMRYQMAAHQLMLNSLAQAAAH